MADEPRLREEHQAGEEPRQGDYRIARISAAAALNTVIIFLLVFDALSPDYAVSEFVVGALLAGIFTLLGIEGLSSLRGGK